MQPISSSVGEREVQGSAQLRLRNARQQPKRHGEEALHVAHAATVGAGTPSTRRVNGSASTPDRRRYDVRVTGEDNAAVGGAVSGRGGDQQVGAGAVLVGRCARRCQP